MIGKVYRIVTAGCRTLLEKGTARRIGVLVAQLGTPDAPTPAALRRYLRQFLSDRRVVERNRALWWFILRLLVLPRRPRRSAALYQRIWSRDGSPLLVISRSQARALEAELNRHEPERFKVALGMVVGLAGLTLANLFGALTLGTPLFVVTDILASVTVCAVLPMMPIRNPRDRTAE